jgi:hypothetical protein
MAHLWAVIKDDILKRNDVKIIQVQFARQPKKRYKRRDTMIDLI